MQVTGLQITMVIDGRSVSFNFQNLSKVEKFMTEPGTLGTLLRGLRDAYPGVVADGAVRNIRVRDEIGEISMIQRDPRLL